MDKENLLLEKMKKEQAMAEGYLKTLTVEEVLERAYEYVTRNDIIIAYECGEFDFTEAQLNKLLASECVLDDILQRFWKMEDDRMNLIRTAIKEESDVRD